jgi:16S rRNA G1207 methylase RsmC
LKFSFNNISFTFTRYPESSNRSLRAWSAADEYILSWMKEHISDFKTVALYHDRFGFLSTTLNTFKPYSILETKSMERALLQNLSQNGIEADESRFINPLTPLPENVDLGIIKIPKSLELYRLYLTHLHASLSDNGVVVCGFMTRHFTPQMTEIASEYFENCEQTLAQKKSRLLILSGKKAVAYAPLLNTLQADFPDGDSTEMKQYFGVFSGKQIDSGSRFLMDHLKVKESEKCILDAGTGNGILALAARKQHEDAEIHVTDDSLLAIESARLNLGTSNLYYQHIDTLEAYKNEFFDLALCNPPFHFDHENTIEISLSLFKQIKRCLKTGGRFVCVANQHLNYKTHLEPLFSSVKVLAENDAFVVYECLK